MLINSKVCEKITMWTHMQDATDDDGDIENAYIPTAIQLRRDRCFIQIIFRQQLILSLRTSLQVLCVQNAAAHDMARLAPLVAPFLRILSSLDDKGIGLQFHHEHPYSQTDYLHAINKFPEFPGCKWLTGSTKSSWKQRQNQEYTKTRKTCEQSSHRQVEIPEWIFESLIPSNLPSTASLECADSTCTQRTSAPNITSGIFLPLMFLLTLHRLGGVSSWLLLSFAVPTLIASWTHRTILVLYLGVSSISAHPIQPFSITERQASTVSSVLTIPLKGWPNTGYCATMRFGENKQQIFCMIVDTGSSNTAIASTPHTALGGMEFFDIHSTGEDFINMSKSVGVTYSSGEWSGYLVKGKVGLGDLSMVEGVFALITSSDKFFIERADWAGILGLAYRSLAKPEPWVGTVWDSVRETNSLQDVFTMQLCPPRESTLFPGTFVRQGGYMTLGGINTSLYHTNKPIHYTKIVEERFFNVLLTDISVGDRKLNISCKEFNTDKTIVDSGTTDIYFPEKVFEAIKDYFTEYFKDGLPIVVPEEFWIGERKLLWQAAHVEEIYECFPTIHLSMADHQNSSQQFTLAIVPQLYLRQINVLVGEADPAVCPPMSPCDGFTFGVKPRAQGTVIGANAMLGYYTVFDREKRRVGFAESTCDYRNSKAVPAISGPHPRVPEDCEMPPLTSRWATITYICGAITMTLATIMTVIVVTVQVKRCSRKSCIRSTATLPKRTINKVKIARKSATMTISKVCCCKFVTPQPDEGYASETTPPAPPSPSDNIEVSAIVLTTPLDTEGNDEIIVPSRQPLVAAESTGTEMVAIQPSIHESTQRAGASGHPRRKSGSKRWKRRHLPVMESETEGLDFLCVDSGHRSRPTSAIQRSYNAYGSGVIVTERRIYQETYSVFVE